MTQTLCDACGAVLNPAAPPSDPLSVRRWTVSGTAGNLRMVELCPPDAGTALQALRTLLITNPTPVVAA